MPVTKSVCLLSKKIVRAIKQSNDELAIKISDAIETSNNKLSKQLETLLIELIELNKNQNADKTDQVHGKCIKNIWESEEPVSTQPRRRLIRRCQSNENQYKYKYTYDDEDDDDDDDQPLRLIKRIRT